MTICEWGLLNHICSGSYTGCTCSPNHRHQHCSALVARTRSNEWPSSSLEYNSVNYNQIQHQINELCLNIGLPDPSPQTPSRCNAQPTNLDAFIVKCLDNVPCPDFQVRPFSSSFRRIHQTNAR